MSKYTASGVEKSIQSSIAGFKARATVTKEAHRSERQSILNDVMTSDLAKQEHLEALDKQTRGKLDAIRGEQEAYVSGLRTSVERELLGHQPTDANSVLLRRDAADRARRIDDEAEALAVLGDAVRSGDDSLAHAVGYRARQSGWVDALDAYRLAQPQSADAAAALAVVEGLERDTGYNLANQITYSAPFSESVGAA
ncbi:hypothetical protein [Agrococcus sp. ProA11]|uniref:hypothetical protein n=1 Tax=Agrococcus chionoecetis TaxID=3153752 RepID=UPI003260461C